MINDDDYEQQWKVANAKAFPAEYVAADLKGKPPPPELPECVITAVENAMRFLRGAVT